MNEEQLIASGLLELYVIGALSSEEIQEVEGALVQYPNVLKEVEEIEAALIGLAEEVGINLSSHVGQEIRDRIGGVRPISTGRSRNWSAISGWAAAVVFLIGLGWMIKQNNDLNSKLRTTSTQNAVMKEQIEDSNEALVEANELLAVMRSNDFEAVKLPGNPAVSAEAYATVYYNKEEKVAYVDAQGLPEPPRGKVYQVWSLIMQPLTPSSMGLLEGFADTDSKFFRLENVPDPEGFGITLEPEGGSDAPTLTQLYTIGTVSP